MGLDDNSTVGEVDAGPASLSVIIPFFKDHAFVEQAVQSVLMQNVENLEIVLVNDNPGAESSQFLNALNLPPAVRIVSHDTNLGLSAARNTGVAEANGTHIAYLDADDYYLPGGLARQFAAAISNGCDVTHATAVLSSDGKFGGKFQALIQRDAEMFHADVQRTDVRKNMELQFTVSCWKSIYRKKFLVQNSIIFDPEQRKFEDRLYVLETMFAASSVCLMAEPVRIWRRRDGSITTSEKSDEDLVMMAALIDKCTHLVEESVAAGRVDQVMLRREVFHAVSRLVWDTPILAAAVSENAVAGKLRKVITRALGRSALDKSIFQDPIVKILDRTGMANASGGKVSRDDFIQLHQAIVAGNWQSVAEHPMFGTQANSAKRQKMLATPKIQKPLAAFRDVALTLHIGLHKTGTTHLQRTFSGNRRAFIEHGWLFPETGFVDHEQIAAKNDGTPGHQGFIHAALHEDARVRRRLAEEIQASGCKNVLISCENMSFPHMAPAQRADRIAALDRFFSGFKQRRVVATLRRPDTYIEALYREQVTNTYLRLHTSALDYVETRADAYLNLEAVFSQWKQLAAGSLVLLNYEDLIADSDLCGAFCAQLGIPMISNLTQYGRTYGSPTRDTIEIVRLINAFDTVQKHRAAVSKLFLQGAAKMTSGRDQSILRVDKRKAIVERMRTHSEDFLLSCGVEYPFDRMISEIEAERENWKPLVKIDRSLLQLAINAAHTRNAPPRKVPERNVSGWKLPAQNTQRRASEEATQQARPSGFLRNMSSNALRNERTRAWLLVLYRHLPPSLREFARAAYHRFAGS